jgi:spore germination protein KC
MNRWYRVLIFLTVLILISGCWDQKELNKVSLITGIAIDKGENKKYKLSVECLNVRELYSKGGSGDTASVIVGIEGNSISELSRKMNVSLSRKLTYSHMRVAVIQEEVAREGILEFFDYLERQRELRDDFDVIIAKGVQASDILTVSYPLQKVSTMKLHTQLDTAIKEWGSDPNIRKKDMIEAWTSEGRQPVTTAVTVTGNPEKGNSIENMKKLKPEAMVELAALSVFKQDKLIGFLSFEDTRNYLWTQDKLKFTSLSISCGKNHYFDIRVYNSKTNIKAKYRDGNPTIELNIGIETRLDGINCKQNLANLETYKYLESRIKDYVEKEIVDTIHHVQQKYKVDIFGFGEDMNRQDYKAYKKVKRNWDEEFSKADIKVNVTAKLRRTGIRTKSFLNEIK